jgi:hypothetical protein
MKPGLVDYSGPLHSLREAVEGNPDGLEAEACWAIVNGVLTDLRRIADAGERIAEALEHARAAQSLQAGLL